MKYKPQYLVAAALVVGLMALGATWASGPRASTTPRTLGHWLNLDSSTTQAVHAADPEFDADMQRLAATAESAQLQLGQLLEQGADDANIRQQLETSLAARAAMERRVTDHLLALRPHLTTDQQKRLMGLAAEGVRQSSQHRYRRGQTSEDTGTPTSGRGRGGSGGGNRHGADQAQP